MQQGRARGLFESFEVEGSKLAAGVDDQAEELADLGLDRVLDRAQRLFRHVRGLLQILLVGLSRAQLADALVDLHEFGAELLEAAKGRNLAFGLVDLGRIGERLLDGLASAFEGEPDLGPWPGWSSWAQT